MTTALKHRLTLKQLYLIPMIRIINILADYLSFFVVVLYVELNITSIEMIVQQENATRTRGSCSSMICGHTILTEKPKGEN